jgi:hypothetical protein
VFVSTVVDRRTIPFERIAAHGRLIADREQSDAPSKVSK